MGFNTSTQAPKLLQGVGAYSGFVVGMATASAGAIDVTLPMLSQIHGVVGNTQAATGVSHNFVVTATSGNNFTGELILTTGEVVTGTSILNYIAWGIPKA
jgi:hypothetical protein